MTTQRPFLQFAALLTLTLSGLAVQAQAPVSLLNVSYDPTRELYVEFNKAFAVHWKAKTGQDLSFKQWHGGSSEQARSIIDGLDADVATLALAGDTDALHKNGNLIPKDFVAALYKNVPVLDTGARGSSITFAQRAQGDVFISWENEANLLEKEFGSKIDVVYPSISILAEPAVTVVDKNVDKKGTRAVAQAYLEYLYTDEGQDIAGKNFYRPISPKAQAKYAKQFPKLNLFTIDQAFGGWEKADKAHFADGASFDQIYTKK
jgi:ABC-type sulfate transport system substrate-binding protein